MTTTTAEAPCGVIKKGTKFLFQVDGETIGGLDEITFTLKNKLKKDLAKMRWFSPKGGFCRTDVEVPKTGDKKNTELYIQERQTLSMWYPVTLFIDADTEEKRQEVSAKLCADYFGMAKAPDVFVKKFREILQELSDILLKFINMGGD